MSTRHAHPGATDGRARRRARRRRLAGDLRCPARERRRLSRSPPVASRQGDRSRRWQARRAAGSSMRTTSRSSTRSMRRSAASSTRTWQISYLSRARPGDTHYVGSAPAGRRRRPCASVSRATAREPPGRCPSSMRHARQLLPRSFLIAGRDSARRGRIGGCCEARQKLRDRSSAPAARPAASEETGARQEGRPHGGADGLDGERARRPARARPGWRSSVERSGSRSASGTCRTSPCFGAFVLGIVWEPSWGLGPLPPSS